MRHWMMLALVVWLGLALDKASASERRVALVLGNGAYQHTIDLPNAPTDARAVAAALRRLGFVVIEGIDLTQMDMQSRLKEFSREMEGADVGLFYYAGHGMQVGGENYLIPIDANPKRERDLDFETLKLDLVMRQLLREAKIKIVILDSCRDNPLAAELSRSMSAQTGGRTRSINVQSGMGAIDTHNASGTLVAFATAPGTVALDGKGLHSPFTDALLQHIETPGIDIDVMMKRVRGQVTKGTKERQVPWTNSSLTGEFHLAPTGRTAVGSAPDRSAVPLGLAALDGGSNRGGQSLSPADGDTADLAAPAAGEKSPARPSGSRVAAGRKLVLPVSVASKPGTGNGPSRSWIGIGIESINSAWAQAVGIDVARGAFVLGIQPAGPAARSELRFGDIVLKAGNREILEASHLPQHVQVMPPGSTVLLEVWRIWEPGGDFLHAVTRLAEAGNLEAMTRLGLWYSSGTGVGRNDIEAARWLRTAADRGDPVAMHGIGQLLIAGRGVVKDPNGGFQWLQRAASAGNLTAMYSLGLLYSRGEGMSKNIPEAIRWLRKAADSKYPPAMFELGLTFFEGLGGNKDLPAAAKWYRAAADAGNAAAMANLGLMYSTGTGLSKDEEAAARWYRSGAEAGNSMAMNNLAFALDQGIGTAQDPEEAAMWMLQAIDLQLQFSFDQMTKNSGAWSREFRREMQRRLKEAGFYQGNLDGDFGQGTQAAIVAYARRAR